MLLKEAKEVLKKNGFILEARGKTNPEDFKKMKNVVSKVTGLSGTTFLFVTTSCQSRIYDDNKSKMVIANEPSKGFTLDTGLSGARKYRHLTRKEVIEIIEQKKSEIEELGYDVKIEENNVIISMPKTPLDAEDTSSEDGITGFWSVSVGDGHTDYIVYGTRYREDGHENPSNIKRIAERVGERYFTMYYSVGAAKKYSSYDAMVKALDKVSHVGIASEEELTGNPDRYYIC